MNLISDSKRKYHIIITLLFFFTLTLFILILIFLTLLSQDSTAKNNSKETYQYTEVNPFTKYRSSGFLRLKKSKILKDDEFLSYRNRRSGNYVLISRFGGPEFRCEGTCFCADESSTRRTASQVLTRGLYVLVSAVSVQLAMRMAEETFRDSCEQKFEGYCENENLESDVSSCQPTMERVILTLDDDDDSEEEEMDFLGDDPEDMKRFEERLKEKIGEAGEDLEDERYVEEEVEKMRKKIREYAQDFHKGQEGKLEMWDCRGHCLPNYRITKLRGSEIAAKSFSQCEGFQSETRVPVIKNGKLKPHHVFKSQYFNFFCRSQSFHSWEIREPWKMVGDEFGYQPICVATNHPEEKGEGFDPHRNVHCVRAPEDDAEYTEWEEVWKEKFENIPKRDRPDHTLKNHPYIDDMLKGFMVEPKEK